MLLRAGALPAKLTPIEQRVVGAGLGQDSIEKGKLASYYGAALVVVFMIATYGLFGVFASIAVGVNVGMIFGVLSLLNATLTLPGIIGVVLTIGIDGRQQRADLRASTREVRTGRTPITAIDAGTARSPPSSIPTSPPSLRRAVLLRQRAGAALPSLGIGIVTTVFAFTLTRLIVACGEVGTAETLAFLQAVVCDCRSAPCWMFPDTKFDTYAFGASTPASAVLSIVAICCSFSWADFNIDFVSGTRSRCSRRPVPPISPGTLDLGGLGLGDVQLQVRRQGVLSRCAAPGGEAAQRAAITRCAGASSDVDYRCTGLILCIGRAPRPELSARPRICTLVACVPPNGPRHRPPTSPRRYDHRLHSIDTRPDQRDAPLPSPLC